MYLSLSRQTWGVCLLSLIVGLVPFVSQSAPLLRNANITSPNENSPSFLTADIGSAGGSTMVLRVNWGDGTALDVYSITNTATNFSVFHYYEDDNPTNTPNDLLTVSLTLSNNTGVVSTNLGVVIKNVAPQLTLSALSHVEVGAPATLRGLNIREFVVPSLGGGPQGICVGPEGNLWFTEYSSNRIGRITTNAVITEFPLGSSGLGPIGIAAGPDDRLWFCASGTGQIGAMTTNGVVSLYTIPWQANEPFKTPQYITRRGAAMWYTDFSYRIGRITAAGLVTTQYVHQAGVNPLGIAVGADNNIWFTAYFTDTANRLRVTDGVTTTYNLAPFSSPALMTLGPDDAVWFAQLGAGDSVPGKIGRINTNGVITNFIVGHTGPSGICAGPDGAIWFTERRRATNSVGRLTLDGELSRFGMAIFSDVAEITGGPDGGIWFTMPGRDRIGRMRYTTAGNVVLSGELHDPGSLDTHFVQIDWGDGTAVETLSLPAGIASFHVAHTYTGSQPTNYTINVTASDDDTGTSSASTKVVSYLVWLKNMRRLANGNMQIDGRGSAGRTITIEASSDLVNWSSVGTITPSTNKWQFIHTNPPASGLVYRGKLP